MVCVPCEGRWEHEQINYKDQTNPWLQGLLLFLTEIIFFPYLRGVAGALWVFSRVEKLFFKVFFV
jgi:hypothetical protein